MPRKRPAFDAIYAKCVTATGALDDMGLVTALVMFYACDEPLRTNLGIKSKLDEDFIVGFRNAIIKHGGLTRDQRKVARRMVQWGMVHIEWLNRAREARIHLGG